MTVKIYSTMTRSLRDFVPITRNTVNMYVYEPTVYNYIHIGNTRSVVAFDIIRHYFEYRDYKVNYISNLTDVDDKVIKGAAEVDVDTKALSDKFIAAFMEDVKQLSVKPATKNPRAIDCMNEIIDFVKVLVDKGFAYEINGDMYPRTAKSQNYARLADKTPTDLEVGVSGHVDGEGGIKENPLDFTLWESAKPGGASWQSPQGEGRPGQRTERSVIATVILGDTIDIHGGRADLEFPHHANKIAQSEAKTGKTFVSYWMHNGSINVDNEEMPESLGNFVTVHDMLRNVDGQVLGLFLATQRYRKSVNFTEKAVHDASVNFEYLKDTFTLPPTEEADAAELVKFKADFRAAMDDGFNTANSITAIFDMAKWINSDSYDQAVKDTLAKVLAIFGIVFGEEILDAGIEALIKKHQAARANKDFAAADTIRDQSAAQGIKLLGTKDGVR